MIRLSTGSDLNAVAERLATAVDAFPSGTAALLDQRILQRRFDRKYLLAVSQLPELLEALAGSHVGLPGTSVHFAPYTTVYFDTAERRGFHDHRRGRPRRAKARFRTYVDRDLTLLEVKQRSGRGTTVKSRRTRESLGELTAEEQRWLQQETAWNSELTPYTHTTFRRLTLLGLNDVERITVDIDLDFALGDEHQPLERVCILEIKTPSRLQPSRAVSWLRARGVRPSGFSKYCVGSVLLDESLPRHSFRPVLRRLHALEAA